MRELTAALEETEVDFIYCVREPDERYVLNDCKGGGRVFDSLRIKLDFGRCVAGCSDLDVPDGCRPSSQKRIFIS
ncbi:hypothetical protein WN943_014156 [Citrus x changshan-huyou]